MTNQADPKWLSFVNEAAKKDDRWLMIAILFGAVLIVGIVLSAVWKYWVKTHEELIADFRAERDANTKTLVKVVGDQRASEAETRRVIEHNSTAITNIGKVVEACTGELQLCREQNQHRR